MSTCVYYLRDKVKDQAFLLIKHYPITNESFPLAWAALKSRYENRRVLIDRQLLGVKLVLLNLPAVTKESADAIKTLHITIKDCLSTLKAQNNSVH